MAQERNYDEDTAPTRPRPPMLAIVLNYAMTILFIGLVSVVLFIVWPAVVGQFQQRFLGAPVPTEQAAPTPLGNVGGQAPPSVRGSNPEPVMPRVVATPIPDVAQNAATAQVMYDAAVRAAQTTPPPAQALKTAPVTLPVNSAGDPVIDQVQQQQQQQALELAADEQQAALRAAQLADAAARPPDVSKAEAEQMLHRDLCHVPRADPHTCEQGLYKPTPVQ